MDKRTTVGLVAALAAMSCGDPGYAGSSTPPSSTSSSGIAPEQQRPAGGPAAEAGSAAPTPDVADAPDGGDNVRPPHVRDASVEMPIAGAAGVAAAGGGGGLGGGSSAGSGGAAGASSADAGSDAGGSGGTGATGGIASWDDPIITGGGCERGFSSDGYRVTLETVVVDGPTTYRVEILYAEINANGFTTEQLARSRLLRCEEQDIAESPGPIACADRSVLCDASDCREYEFVDMRRTRDGWVRLECGSIRYATNSGARSGEIWNTVQLVIPP